VNNDVRHSKLPNWCKATTDTIVCYKDVLNNYLTNIDIPKDRACVRACVHVCVCVTVADA